MDEQIRAIALALREMRLVAGLSQAEVGEQLGATAQSGQAILAKWEAWAQGKKSGKQPGIEHLSRWAQVFGMTVEVSMRLKPRVADADPPA